MAETVIQGEIGKIVPSDTQSQIDNLVNERRELQKQISELIDENAKITSELSDLRISTAVASKKSK